MGRKAFIIIFVTNRHLKNIDKHGTVRGGARFFQRGKKYKIYDKEFLFQKKTNTETGVIIWQTDFKEAYRPETERQIHGIQAGRTPTGDK